MKQLSDLSWNMQAQSGILVLHMNSRKVLEAVQLRACQIIVGRNSQGITNSLAAAGTHTPYGITWCYTQGDSDVVSTPAGFRRHLVGKTLRNDFHFDIAEIRFVGKLVIIQTVS